MLFSVTFRDIPKIDNHGSNSHLAPNVCFGNDTFFENPNIFPKKNSRFFLKLEFEAGWGMVGRSLSADSLQNPCKSWCSRPNLRRRSGKWPATEHFGTPEGTTHPQASFWDHQDAATNFFFRPLRISLVNLNPWNPYCSPSAVSCSPSAVSCSKDSRGYEKVRSECQFSKLRSGSGNVVFCNLQGHTKNR